MNLRSAFEIPVPAIVLAEGAFGRRAGKTANGVVSHSDIFEPCAIVDSECVETTAAAALGRDDITDAPIVPSVAAALDRAPDAAALIIGAAPAGGVLPPSWRAEVEAAIRSGCDIVSGLHEFLGDDDHWQALADRHDVTIHDIRKPPAVDELRVADGRAKSVDADVVLIAGTDCAVGKRTTTSELYAAAVDAGIDTGWVATGQTGIMVGAHVGVVIDRVPSDFAAGVVENLVCEVAAAHDLVFVEGQASLTHRAYSGVSLSILHGAWPDAVVLAHQPDRRQRSHFTQFPVDGVERERRLIESLADATIAGVSTWGDPAREERRYDLPAANVYETDGPSKLLAAVLDAV